MPEPFPGGELEALAEALADPLYEIVAHLAQGPIGQQTQPVDLATLVECTFPGYAAIPLVNTLDKAWEQDGYGEMSPIKLEFTAGAIVTPQRVTHVYYTHRYNGQAWSLLSAVAFDHPITVALPGDIVALECAVGCLATAGE